jgi:hypothetical protein
MSRRASRQRGPGLSGITGAISASRATARFAAAGLSHTASFIYIHRRLAGVSRERSMQPSVAVMRIDDRRLARHSACTTRSGGQMLMSLRSVFFFIVLATSLVTLAQAGTILTYQGKLEQSGQPAEGVYDLRFSLYETPVGDSLLAQADPVEGLTIDSSGLFQVEIDFGPMSFGGGEAWLQVEVAEAGTGSFSVLDPRQLVTPVPKARYAVAVPWEGIQDVPPGLDDGDDDTTYTAGAGVSLSGSEFNIDYVAVDERYWARQGNAAMAGDFLGTSNATPLQFRVNNRPVATILDEIDAFSGEHAPNWIAGSESNVLAASGDIFAPVVGATIVGGGGNPAEVSCGPDSASPCVNTVGAAYATVLGGFGNYATGTASVAMGTGNAASADDAIAMGSGNRATGSSAVALGNSNTASGSGGAALGRFSTALANGSVAMGSGATASGIAAIALGDLVEANASISVALGAQSIVDATYGMALGRRARVASAHEGTFVWSDSSFQEFVSSGPDQFLINAGGGVGINTNAPGSFDLAVGGSAAKPGGGSWSSYSDRALKEDIRPLQSGVLDRVLSLRGYSFRFSDEALDRGWGIPGEHVGLIAQEVADVFPGWVEEDAEGYLYVTERGQSAIMVEALRELKQENDTLRAELEALEAEVARLAQRVSGP